MIDHLSRGKAPAKLIRLLLSVKQRYLYLEHDEFVVGFLKHRREADTEPLDGT